MSPLRFTAENENPRQPRFRKHENRRPERKSAAVTPLVGGYLPSDGRETKPWVGLSFSRFSETARTRRACRLAKLFGSVTTYRPP
jgi:hypothetical protein